MYPRYNRGFHLPIDPACFPREALGPKTRSLYDPVVDAIGIPSVVVGPMVVHGAIAYANPVANMLSPHGRTGPYGIYTKVSAVSGCGKTEAKKAVFAEMEAFQREQLTNVVDGEDPIETHITYNASMPALMRGLAKYPVANENDDEFTSAQTGSMARYANIRNQLFDGQTFSVDRATSGRYILHDPRFTSLVLTQPHVRIAFDEKHGKRLRAQGLATRTQFAEYAGEPVALNFVPIDSRLWDETARHFLHIWLDVMRGGARRGLVKLRSDAVRLQKGIVDSYRARGLRGGDLEQFEEHAARQPESIVRIAAGLHVFEGIPGDVTGEELERAEAIGSWFTEHYKLRFQPKLTVPPEYEEADHLAEWLRGFVYRTGELSIRRSDLRAHAPEMGLSKAAVERALTVLCSSNYARIVLGKSAWIELNPSYFHPRRHVNPWSLHSQF
ncbi:DUF3987 domain-containing protein [Burkholderia plantarii]|uniref:DUF3987 domain-containing protein n=1 Tax=Burkholderia plantarii TaxID=41899 RepID=UPI0018DE6E7D|nr:DUF3987 domain-containing protein [Burkholderia plantarii]MBI0326872.1 DUF3987 domain-containing protein [Burkholderia plantarii]